MLKKIIDYFNGHKRNIGWFIAMVGTGLSTFDILPQEQADFILRIGIGIGGVGAWHSYKKDGTINKIIKKKQDG